MISFVFALFSLELLTFGCPMPKSYEMVEQEPAGALQLIKDNTIVFWGISQEDYDALFAADPAVADIMEMLSEYYVNSFDVARTLESQGFIVIFGSWKEVEVQITKGKTRRVKFNPKDLKAILMKAKGKEPKIVTEFFGEYPDMIKIISEYFNIDLSL